MFTKMKNDCTKKICGKEWKMMNIATTKIYKNFQTSIPKEMREAFNINEKTIVEWGINEKGEPEVNFRNKVELKDIIGMVKTEEVTDSVKLKREIYLK